MKERPGHSAREALLEYLRDRQALLLLDNFEHVLEAASFLRELLAGAPGVKLLVTSRAPLGVPEERVYPVPALELPDRSQRRSVPELGEIEAIRLFVDRARAARPDFELSETNAEIGDRAVRSARWPAAGARARRGTMQSAFARRAARAPRLEARPPEGCAGLRSRRAPVDAPRGDRVELRPPAAARSSSSSRVSLSSSAGSRWPPPSTSPGSPTSTSWRGSTRSSGTTCSRPSTHEGTSRGLGMLETIREYALERLAARGDGEAVRRRHAAFYLVLAEEAEPGLLGPQQREWLERLDAERDNIRASLTWAVDAGEAEDGPEDRLGALALLAAAEPRTGGARAPRGTARARLRLAAHPRESPNDDRVAVVRSRRLRDGATRARGEPSGAPPLRRRAHDLEHARASRFHRRGRGFGRRPEPGSSRGGSQGGRPVRGGPRPVARRCRPRRGRGAR